MFWQPDDVFFLLQYFGLLFKIIISCFCCTLCYAKMCLELILGTGEIQSVHDLKPSQSFWVPRCINQYSIPAKRAYIPSHRYSEFVRRLVGDFELQDDSTFSVSPVRPANISQIPNSSQFLSVVAVWTGIGSGICKYPRWFRHVLWLLMGIPATSFHARVNST